MKINGLRLKGAFLNLGELHRNLDPGFFYPVFQCVTEQGEEFTVRMRLHVTEPLDRLVIADPRRFGDEGFAANSCGSTLLNRRSSYSDPLSSTLVNPKPGFSDEIPLYEITAEQIKAAVLGGYVFSAGKSAVAAGDTHFLQPVAFTCHDPSIIGGGNIILFRMVNWLADLGVKVTIYSCGSTPFWTRVSARFRNFTSYAEMFASIEEETVILFSMWHIEPMLRSQPLGKRIYHLRQIVETYHFGMDYQSMIARKPVIELLESLPLGSIAISPHIQDWYSRELGVSSFLITNGIDPSEFYPLGEAKKSSKVVRIASVGDPTHFVKGIDVLAEALRLLALRRPDLQIKWVMAFGQERNIPNQWFDGVKNLEFTPQVGLTRSQMRDLYHTADIFVCPSLYEGFGLPSLEAMASGIPVIQADNQGLDFIIEDERDCLVVPIHDARSMSSAIERVVNDRDLAKRLSEQGLVTASQHTTTHQFEQFKDTFETILNVQFGIQDVDRIRRRLPLASSLLETADASEPARGSRQRELPLISVVIPTYNQADYLRQALDSLLAQSYSNWEAVVVNDGSKDHTLEVMNEYASRDARIKPNSKPNGGITSALNYGLERAVGEYFCWLSSDDLFYPEKIEAQVKAFTELDESFALVYGSFDLLIQEEQRIDIQPFAEPVVAGAEFPEALKFDFIDGCTIMIRMDVMREVGGFNPYFRHSKDMELWVRIASRGYHFYLLDKKLTIRRVHLAQSSTGNMIHCRYDAAWMINYYLEHFHLLEMYRYFDFSSEKDIDRFLGHFVGRMLHTEANVNHPLLQKKFWDWFDAGISALTPDVQMKILRKCFILMLRSRAVTAKMDYYLGACLDSMGNRRVFSPVEMNFSVVGRDIRYDRRDADPFGKRLFDYGTDLFINAHTPLFAQELYFHNTNKVVDTPYKLGHSAIRYLSQFANPFQELVLPYAQFSQIPETADEALALFCHLHYPKTADTLLQHQQAIRAREYPIDLIEQMESEISHLPADYLDDLGSVCGRHPTEPVLYYWYALNLAQAGDLPQAVEQGWIYLMTEGRSCPVHAILKIAEWAERVKDIEKAWTAYHLALGVQGNFRSAIDGLARLSRKLESIQRLEPTPAKFLSHRDSSQLPAAHLVHCFFFPRLDGSFTLRIGWEPQKGAGLYTQEQTFPYSMGIQAFQVVDPATHRLYKILPSDIFKLWSGGYDFVAESQRFIQRFRSAGAKPAVAFTLLNSSIQGGGPMMVYRYANWLVDLGVDVTIYSNDKAPQWISLKANFQTIPDEHQRYAAIREPVIVVYSILEMPVLLQNANLSGKRVLHLCQGVEDFNYHGTDYASLLAVKPMFQMLHSLPVGRLVVSPHLRTYFLKNYQQQAFRIFNGIDLNTFKPRWKRPISERIHITIVGNPDRLLKGAADVKQALLLLVRRHPEWKLHLNILCGDKVIDDDDLFPQFPGLTRGIYWGLSQEEMRDVYYRTDVFINPAWYEGFGLPSLEAMGCGVPVVQVNNQGLDEIAVDRENCLLVPAQNPARIAAAIEEILTDPALQEKVISGGFEKVREFSLQSQFDQFVSAFQEILLVRFDAAQVQDIRQVLEANGLNERIMSEINQIRPLISVLVPAYNHARYLPAALESLLAQTYPNWEAIVVNDGSTDDTAMVMEQYAARDRRIRIFHKANGGAASALNEGLRQARGEWLCWLSSDDLFESNKLLTHVAAIDHFPGIKFFHTHYYFLDEKTGKKTAPSPQLHKTMPIPELQVLRFFWSNYISGNCIAIHHSVFDQVGFFNPSLHYGQDFDMWLRISARFNSFYLDERTCTTRIHAGQDTSRFPEAGPLDSALACLNFLNEHRLVDLFPLLDLSKPQHVFFAIQNILQVVTNPEAFINIAGYTPALLDRVSEWLSQDCPIELRSRVRGQIAGILSTVDLKKWPMDIQHAIGRLLRAADEKMTYTPYPFRTLIQQRTSVLEMAGNLSGAEVLRRYLAYRDQKDAGISVQTQIRSDDLSQGVHADDLVSIIVPTYNRPEKLWEALDSIARQSYPNFEVIVVNDGGRDVSQVIKPFQKKNIQLRYVVHPENRGAGAARNTGMKLASGKYIAFLDDDDRYYPDHLSALVKKLEEDSSYTAVYSDALQITIDARQKKERFVEKRVVYSREYSRDELFVANYIPILCLVVRRDAVEQAGHFNEKMTALEDWEWLIRLAMVGGFRHIQLTTAEYTVRQGGGTRNMLSPQQIASLYQQIYSVCAPEVSAETRQRQRDFYRSMTGGDLFVDLPHLMPEEELPEERAAQTLEILLEAEDLLAALEQNRDRLDGDLLSLVRMNAQNAQAEGQVELAEGLNDLADYIEKVLSPDSLE